MKKRILSIKAAFMVVAVLAFVMVSSAGAEAYPDLIPLPNGFQPEGIVISKGHTAYAGSLANGDVVEVDLRTGAVMPLVDGPGTRAVGLSFDARSDYLYVSGGANGDGRIYDTNTGDLVMSYAFGGGFVNDAVVTRDAVYFTDSGKAFLYKVALGPTGTLAATFDALPLGGDFVLEQGFNTNGIVALPNGAGLIIVQSNTGKLFFVDPATGDATTIDLGGANVANGDGLVLVGKSLYVVQNALNKISQFKLSSNYLSAMLVDEITNSNFDFPTTADNHGSALYAVNARFSTPPGPTVTYDIVKVKR